MAATLVTPHRSRPRLLVRPTSEPAADLGSDEPGRLALWLGALLLFLVLGALTIVGGRGGLADLAGPPASPAGVEASEQRVLVQPGDTVWGIARRLQPEGDVRPLVDRIIALNGGAELRAGQHLLIPG